MDRIWIEFGFNVGCEFGGRHVAVILKHVGECVVVAPLTSGTADSENHNQIDIDYIFNFNLKKCYTDITRVTPVSLHRIDLNDQIGKLKNIMFSKIISSVKDSW